MVTCVVCKQDNGARHSLRLVKDEKKVWVPQPVCPSCRKALISEAKASGKFIPIFGLEASKREAEKRNRRVEVFQPFLDQFACDRQEPEAKTQKGNKSHSRRAKS